MQSYSILQNKKMLYRVHFSDSTLLCIDTYKDNSGHMNKISSSEQRKHLRIGLIVDIELTLPGEDTISVRTKNISDGGLFLVLDDSSLPPIGTEVRVRLKNQLGDGEDPPVNRAMVVRAENEGIGLEFLE